MSWRDFLEQPAQTNTQQASSGGWRRFLTGGENEPFSGYGGFQAAPPQPEAPRFGVPPQEFPGFEDFQPPDPRQMLEQQVAGQMAPEEEPVETFEDRRQKIGKLRAKYIKYPELLPFLEELEADDTLDFYNLEKEFLYAVAQREQEKAMEKEQTKLAEKAAKDEERRYEKFMRDQQRDAEKQAQQEQKELQRLQQEEQKAVTQQQKFDVDLQKEAMRQEAKAGPTIGQQAAGLGAEVALGLGGQVAGALFPPLYPVLSFAGGFAGSLAAQEIEGQDKVSWGRAIRDGLLNVLPGAKPVKAATTAGRIAKTTARGAAIGAGAGAVGEVIETGIEEERLPTIEEIQSGAAGGAVVGGAFTALGEAFQSAYRKFAGRTTAELDAAYNAGDPDARLVVDTMKKTAKDAPEDVAQTRVIEEAERREVAPAPVVEEPTPPVAAVEPTPEQARRQVEEEIARMAPEPAPRPVEEPAARPEPVVDLEPPPRQVVTVNGQEYKWRPDGKWFNRRTGTVVENRRTLERIENLSKEPIEPEVPDAVQIRETETLPVGERAEGRPPVDREVREQAPPVEGKVPEEEIVKSSIGQKQIAVERVKTSDKDTGAYHYGDAGIAADTTDARMTTGRSTGHFGTGTYFLGSKEPGTARQNRPIVNIDTSGLNLATPGSSAKGMHDALRLFNNDIKSGKLFQYDQPRFNGWGIRSKLETSLRMRHSEKQIQDAMEKVRDIFISGKQDGLRSPSTYLMQELGYDGIDVRGTNLDNTDYGSVIFVKPKPEAPQPTTPEAPRPPVEEGVPAVEPALPQYLTRRAQLKDEAKQLGLTIREGAPTPEIETAIARANALKSLADSAIAKAEKTSEDFAIIGAEKINRGITGKAWVDEMTREYGEASAARDIYGKSMDIFKKGKAPRVPQPKPPEGMEERRTVTRAGEGKLKEEAVQLRETGEAFREVTPLKALAEKAVKDTQENSAQTWNSIKEELDPKTKVSRAVGYINAQTEKGIDVTTELDELAKMGTDAGTILRALREINMGTPKSRAKIATDAFIRFAKAKKQQVSEETLENIRSKYEAAEKIKDEAQRMKAYREAVEYSVSNLKLRAWDWIDAYRYTNTLSSPRTHERNIVGNVFNVALNRPLALVGQGDLKGALTYTANAAKSIGDATERFKNVFKGDTIPVRSTDDVTSAAATDDLGKEYQKKVPKVFQFVPKFLEAQDQFFSQIIKGGEIQRLLAKGVDPKVAAEKADQLAENYLYRDRVGETLRDQSANAFSRAIDGIGMVAQGLRKQDTVFGKMADHMIMFVRTPIKIAERGFEFSPLGYAVPGVRKEGGKIWQRDWGFTDDGIARGKYGKSYSKLSDEQKADVQFWKKERIGRANAGTAVTALGGLMAMEGNTTWKEPSDPEEKAAFYESGRKPYSVKIGDKWVPYITFGPLSLAFALPAAVRDWTAENPNRVNNSTAENIAQMATGLANFFMTQTPVDGMAKMFQTLTGQMGYDQTKLMETLGFTASQYIPLGSLQRYVNQWIDGQFKKTDGFWDEIRQNVVGQSKDLIPHTTMDGEPAKRTKWDLLPPFAIGVDQPATNLEKRRAELERKNLAKKKADELVRDYKKGLISIEEILNFYNSLDEEDKQGIRRRLRMADERLAAAFDRMKKPKGTGLVDDIGSTIPGSTIPGSSL